MRLIIASLLVFGGGLAALATVWFFYISGDPQTSQQTDITLNDTQAQDRAAAAENSAPAVQADNTGPAAQSTGAQQKNTNNEAQERPLVIDVARIGPDGSAVFAGTAQPHAKITLFDGDIRIAEATANDDGEWVAVPDDLLSAGNHLISAEMQRADGTVSRAEQAVIVELATAENKPLVALVPMTDDAAAKIISAPEQLGTVVTETADAGRDGGGSQSPARDISEDEVREILVVPPEIYIGTLSWGDTGALRIKGRLNGGSGISGSFAGRPFADIFVDQSGAWEAQVTGLGTHKGTVLLRANLLDADNNIALTTEVEVNMAQLDVGLDGSEMVIIRKGDMLWRIAYRTYGNGIRYLDIVKRNEERISDPDLIYPAQVFALPDTENNANAQ